ncbi:hypothetical protein K438DRAFT_1876499 [Mycena galopus ATCC 62051]|nr:hypothetical protein K438DRAFT_1876499 [Mycena galopus ATCC 62051]
MASTLKMSESAPPFPSHPVISRTCTFRAGIIHLPADLIIQGEHRTYKACPYLKHSASSRHFIFDLGLRRDWGSYPPETQKHYGTLMPSEVPQSVDESCEKGGVHPADVERIVISHLHFDHIGDCRPWIPGNPTSRTLTASTPMDRTVFLTAEDFNTSIGPFPHAVDFFGDGSVYIIDTPGHCAGHVTVLARTSNDGAWMYLGGDVAHDRRLILDASTHIGMAAESGSPYCMHRDPVQAVIDIQRVRALVQLPQVEFIIAHDWQWYEENIEHASLPGMIIPKV